MTSTDAAAIYVGLNIVLLVALGARVVARRIAAGVAIGDGGDEELSLRIRSHGNASEYVPAFLVGLFMSAALGLAVWLVHLYGLMFTAGRVAHAWGLSKTVVRARQAGMVATWTAMLLVAGALVYQGIS